MKLRLGIVVSLLASSAQAQSELRTIEVPSTSGWQHAESELTVPAKPLGMTRNWLRASGPTEDDVISEYKDAMTGVTATLYVYKTQLPDAAIWFDRSLDTIRALPMWRLAEAPRPTVLAFARPDASMATGLISGFDVNGGGQRGTALAIVPLNGWLVKVRMSSPRLDGAAITERLRAFVAALRWPKSSGEAQPAVPIEACPNALKLMKAKMIKGDMSESLLGGLLAAVSTSRTPARPLGGTSVYCKEAIDGMRYGMYRANASSNSYILALGDAGIALSLQPTLTMDQLARKESTKSTRWSMSLLNGRNIGVLPIFDRLPPPEQAFRVAMSDRPAVSMSVGAKKD